MRQQPGVVRYPAESRKWVAERASVQPGLRLLWPSDPAIAGRPPPRPEEADNAAARAPNVPRHPSDGVCRGLAPPPRHQPTKLPQGKASTPHRHAIWAASNASFHVCGQRTFAQAHRCPRS